MAKFSDTFIKARFKNAMDAAGLPVSDEDKSDAENVGKYQLDYYGYGGGWQIVQVSKGGGHSQPFGGVRYRGPDFVNVLGVIRDTAHAVREHSRIPYVNQEASNGNA